MTTRDLRYPKNAKRYFIFNLLGFAGISAGIYMIVKKIEFAKHIAGAEYTVHAGHIIIGGIVIMVISKLMAKPSKKVMMKWRENISEYNKNKKDIIVISNLDPKSHVILDTISAKGSSQKEAMDEIYLRAINRRANVIVINGTDVSTHRNINVTTGHYSASATTTNTDTFYIMATLARDKKRPSAKANIGDLSRLREQIIKDAADSSYELKL